MCYDTHRCVLLHGTHAVVLPVQVRQGAENTHARGRWNSGDRPLMGSGCSLGVGGRGAEEQRGQRRGAVGTPPGEGAAQVAARQHPAAASHRKDCRAPRAGGTEANPLAT